MNAISIVVPTLNESDNISVLLHRIAKTFSKSDVTYEVIFIDDNSKDGTQATIKKLATRHPVRLYQKIGSRGKAYSLLEGFDQAQYEVICMIDADLQYPPEAILPMYKLMVANNVDVVLTQRRYAGVSKFRQLSTNVFNLIFTRLLFGFNYDSQSGLKLFHKNVIKDVNLVPTPWSFDMEFIVRALENNFKILSYDIDFSERHSGEAKVRFLKVTYELSVASLKLKFRSSPGKIKRAYRMNIKLAEKAAAMTVIAIVSLLGAVSFATIISSQNTSAVGIIRSAVDPLTSLLQGTASDSPVTPPASLSMSTPETTVMPIMQQPPTLQLSNSDSPAASGMLAPNMSAAINTNPATGQALLMIPNNQPVQTSTTQIAEATYPLRNPAQTYTYSPSSAGLPAWIPQLLLSSLVAIAILTGAYAAVTTRRALHTSPKTPGATS